MKPKIKLILVFTLFLTLISFNSCKRSALDYPSPTGPSTFAVVLKVSASPNVILAGLTRQTATITANLKKYDGVALSDETIHFDIRDATGNKAYYGFFEGNQSITTKTTDTSGNVTITYYGPLAAELELITDVEIYIYAFVEWEGKEYIIEMCPVYIIRDIIELNFDLFAVPNVLWATSERPESQITATLNKADGIPVSGWKVYFKILSGPGNFSGGTVRASAITDATGSATVTYIGPLKSELAYDTFVTIQGQPETVSPDYLHKEVEIRLVKGTD
jgi:hypothetical protein